VRTPYRKILYKFGKRVAELFLFENSKGDIVKSKTNSFSELVKEGRKTILKEWQATKRGVFLKSEAEIKNGVLHGKKVVYDSDGWVSQIMQYRDGKLEGASYSYNKDADIVTEINYKNDVRHGEAFLVGSSMFGEGALTKGVRVLSDKSTSNKEFVALYENGNVIELYFSRFGIKIAKVHENMISEIILHGDLP
jgi:antitoxin component YwqK of YwqJK toxin-antitoxin module